MEPDNLGTHGTHRKPQRIENIMIKNFNNDVGNVFEYYFQLDHNLRNIPAIHETTHTLYQLYTYLVGSFR